MVMADLLKPSPITVAVPMPWMADASVIVVAKVGIEQFWANRSGAEPWPGWWHGYGWLLFVMQGEADAHAREL